MYSETKGERTYKLNKMGALCLALSQSPYCQEPVDPIDLVGKVVNKKQMNLLLNIKLKLDRYVSKAKFAKQKSEFKLTEAGTSIAYDMGFSGDPLSFLELSKFIRTIGRIPPSDRIEQWKENIMSLSSKQVWTGQTFYSQILY